MCIVWCNPQWTATYYALALFVEYSIVLTCISCKALLGNSMDSYNVGHWTSTSVNHPLWEHGGSDLRFRIWGLEIKHLKDESHRIIPYLLDVIQSVKLRVCRIDVWFYYEVLLALTALLGNFYLSSDCYYPLAIKHSKSLLSISPWCVPALC